MYGVVLADSQISLGANWIVIRSSLKKKRALAASVHLTSEPATSQFVR
jgi:hypothetical protein